MENEIENMVLALAERLQAAGQMVTCAESCTGGWIAKAMTDMAGSSSWFERGFVTYSNQSKQEMLGVSPETLQEHGAVSRETVLEMAMGALANSAAQFSVAVSGVAGPGGGTPEKPVGTVWLAWSGSHFTDAVCKHFDGDRETVRKATVHAALHGLLERL